MSIESILIAAGLLAVVLIAVVVIKSLRHSADPAGRHHRPGLRSPPDE